MKIADINYPLLDYPSNFRRLGAGIIDFIILSLLTFAVFLGCSYQIIKVIPDFVNKDQIREEEMRELYQISEEAGLLTLNDEGLTYSQSQLFEFYAYKHIEYAYQLDPDFFISSGLSKIDNPYDFISINSPSDDDFYQFYVNYANEHQLIDYGNNTPREYYLNNVLKDYGEIFRLSVSEGIVPFNNAFALSLYREINGSSESSEYLTKLSDFYTLTFSKAETLLRNDPTYLTHYQIYETNYLGSMQYMAFGILISYFISYLAAYFFPTFFTKYGFTLGRFIFKLVMFKNGEPAKKLPKLAHLSLSFILQYFSLALPFIIAFGTNFLSAPFFISVNTRAFNNLLLCLISAIAFIIMYFSAFIRRDSRSLNDLICKIEIKNAKYYLEKNSK